MNLSPDQYRAEMKRLGGRAPRGKPELQLQIRMAEWLRKSLRKDVPWTASAAGVFLGIRAAGDLKASGLNAGFPDLQFLCPDGVTRYIEVKTRSGSMSKDQKDFRDAAVPHGIWARARTLEELIAVVTGWGLVEVSSC